MTSRAPSPNPDGVYAHPTALVESDQIGRGTRIWAFAHVLPNARIGEDCNICDHTFIENDVFIGDRVTIKCGVQVWDGLRIEDDVFVGPNVAFTNDRWPRSGEQPKLFPNTILKRGASLGANVTVLAGVTIGQNAMVGAGAVVTRSVPPFAVVVGNPARIVRYISKNPVLSVARVGPASDLIDHEIGVGGVHLLHRDLIKDLRGNLMAREVGNGLPFTPRRFFVIQDVPSKEVRGEHAHRELEQLLICMRGAVSVLTDDGTSRQEVILDSPELALYLPPMIWAVQYRYTVDAVLLVMASDVYDPDDYIRDYDQFLRERKALDEISP
jgi:UDP-2-acetamido-3-amino-2,3-dideoxy-glucuronate N-acetyltransferase